MIRNVPSDAAGRETSGNGAMPSLLDSLPSVAYVQIRSDSLDRTPLQNRLRVLRAERGLSQEELAAMVGVSRQTICSIETRQYCPSTLLAFQLARELRVPVAELFALEEDRT